MSQPEHGGIKICNNCGPGSFPFSPYFVPHANYTGFDSFQYFYYPVGVPGPNSNTADVFMLLIGNDDAQNAGACRYPLPPQSVGQPVNVTNGNMWLEQSDYALPGIGEPIEVKRFYNSMIQASGLFGFGWSTKYDESLGIYADDKMIRLNEPDGKASYFGRATTTVPFKSYSQSLTAQIDKNGDGTYNLNYKDGRVHKFSSAGKLLWQRDRNGNQATLNYNGSGVLTGISDAVGRTLTVSMNGFGNVSQISDSMGTVATYDYFPSSSLLQSVTYADGSKFTFEYDTTTVPSKKFLKTVKDVLNNIVETHVYDSQGRATTSERHGGVEKYTLVYDQSDFYGLFTQVTDARNNVTKYYFTRQYGTNLITRTDGACSCGGGGSEVTRYEYDLGNSKLNLVKKV